jgi:hypothetical protein
MRPSIQSKEEEEQRPDAKRDKEIAAGATTAYGTRIILSSMLHVHASSSTGTVPYRLYSVVEKAFEIYI